MGKSNGLPTMVVVGLGMVLIAGLAAVAAWAWSQRRGPLLAGVRGRSRPSEADAHDESEDDEQDDEDAVAATNGVAAAAEA